MSVRASGRPEVAAAEMLSWLLALGSSWTPLQSAELLRNLRAQPKYPLIPSHTHWWQMKGKSTGLADIQALLSQAAAASVPLKQSNVVLSNISFRERHLMNPHRPIYRPDSTGQGTRCFRVGRSATAAVRATVSHFGLEQIWFQVTHKPTNNPSPPQVRSVVPSSGPDTSMWPV